MLLFETSWYILVDGSKEYLGLIDSTAKFNPIPRTTTGTPIQRNTIAGIISNPKIVKGTPNIYKTILMTGSRLLSLLKNYSHLILFFLIYQSILMY